MPADVDYWTGTVKGPGKIVAVLLADKYPDSLRAYAGVALVRMGPREDVDGVAELQSAVRSLPESSRARLVDAMVPDLTRLMSTSEGEEAEPGGAPANQVRAKDAAFLLVPYASPERRRELTESVVDWFVVDFNGRSLAGNYSAEQVIRQLGAVAASRLVNAMSTRQPPQALVKLSELTASLGDEETKGRAAARLVAVEQEMQSAVFLDWLKGRLREQMRERHPDQAVDEGRVSAAASLNRENYLTLGALPAMKHLADQAVIRERLLAIAQLPGTDEATVARRTKALQALEGNVAPEQVSALMDLALDAATPVPVRDYAFDRVGDGRDPRAIPRLWGAFSSARDWRVRWRLGSLILTLGGAEVVQEFFGRLANTSYAREELYNYGERLSQIRPHPTTFVNTQLRSDQWFDRCIALYYHQRLGESSDLPRLERLTSDGATTQGEHWDDQTTVGKVAESVVREIRSRLGNRSEGGGSPTAERGAGG